MVRKDGIILSAALGVASFALLGAGSGQGAANHTPATVRAEGTPGCDDGGPRDDCTPIFQMTISPPESCLVVEPGTPTSFPTLSGTNDCTETFTVAPSPAIDAADGASLAFGAGKPFSVPISPTNPALPASNAPGTWTFPAALGSQSLTITVSRAPSDECP